MLTTDYNRCVKDFSDPLYRFILKSAGDSELARDVVQEAFTRLWEKRHDVDGGKAKSYLFTTGYHCMIDHIRREKRQGDIEKLTREPEVVRTHHSDLQAILHEALERLPEIQRSVILLRDYEGYQYAEIGEMCGLSESQVKVYIFRARKTLKAYIGKMEAVI